MRNPSEAEMRTLADGTQQLNATIDSIDYTITEESVRRQLQLADASGINMLQNEEIFAGLQNIGPLLPAMLTIDAGQPQPSAALTSSQPVPTPTPSHIQIPPSPITQPPPTLIQPVQSTAPPPQPSSVQLTSSPPSIQPDTQPTPSITFSSTPITTILDTQPTLLPSPQIPSPSYHDTEEGSGSRKFLPKQIKEMNCMPPEKSKDSGSSSRSNKSIYLRGCTNLTNELLKDLRESQAPLDFEEPAESQDDIGSTLQLQVNTAEVNTAELVGNYLDKILKRFRMENSKKGSLPLHHGIKISNDLCPVTDEELDQMS
ncbi:hypothetical protein Tco_1055753 [Tanacetum coccineum]|uniref:Uncharacterized protein n=1 Tax=Tanacetum coccineum TaxID=301880 RepID=A0ABQ5H0M6_9ASTR